MKRLHIQTSRATRSTNSVTASILVGVLWCLALLSVVVIGVLHTARLDLMVVKNHGDSIQAHYLALAGVEKAKAVIYHDMLNRKNTGKNHTADVYNNEKEFRDVQFSRGMFRVVRNGQPDESDSIIYGVSDEESRLNINTISAEQLSKLEGMTPDIVAAIVDWRDGDNAAQSGGAEADYYATLQPPRLPRNGPFQTIRELLMVRGMTPDLLYGDDKTQGGIADLNEDGDSAIVTNPGWANLLTVSSTTGNLNARGEDRVNLQSANETQLTGVRGITTPIAKAIIASRNQEQFKSIADLLDVPEIQNQPPGAQAANRSSSSAPKAISEELFIEIADDITLNKEEQPGVINVNTASLDVLKCIHGITPELAQAIINHRKSSGYFANVASVLKVPGMNREIFKQIAPRLAARSETFRIISEGKVTSTGTRRCIETVVHVARYNIKILSYREDL